VYFYTCFTYIISTAVSWNSAGAVTAEQSSALQARNQASEREIYPNLYTASYLQSRKKLLQGQS